MQYFTASNVYCIMNRDNIVYLYYMYKYVCLYGTSNHTNAKFILNT